MTSTENEDEHDLDWKFEIESPIFQILRVTKKTGEVVDIPFNLFLEKDLENIRLYFVDNFLYADHSYKFLPEYR